MKSNPVKKHLLVRGLLAALAAGSVFEFGQGCTMDIQREMEVLTHPEANSDQFYDSYLMTHSWGRELVKWWNKAV